jgi:hypothetical protein
MILLYTGASEYNREQPNWMLSRGGFISSTVCGNKFFDEVSLNILINRKEEFLGLILKNTTASNVTNVRISWSYTVTDSSQRMCNIEYKSVLATGEKVEQLLDPFSEPNVVSGSWIEALTASTIIDPLPVNGMVLLWFKRKINPSFKVPKELTDAELETYYETISAIQEEGINLKIEYN